MEYRVKLTGVATLLLCVAFGSQALTLGRIRGAALVGQPLNMVVPVQISPGEDASIACFEADVFHADARQDPSRVRLALEPSGQTDSLNIRIQSAVAVDEPVVTVYLRTVCDQKTTRRYVLLADFPSDAGSVVAPVRAPAVPLVVVPLAEQSPPQSIAPATAARTDLPAVAAEGTAAPAPAPAPPVRAKTVSKPKVVQKVVKRPVQPAPAPKSVVAAPKTAAAPAASLPPVSTGQPRLTLDAPPSLPAQPGALVPTPAPDVSAEAQASLLKIQTLENDVKALLALAAKNEASLLDLRTRLQEAESERLPNWMVYGLGALVLACLAVIALLLRRSRPDIPVDNGHWSASVAAVSPGSEPLYNETAGLPTKLPSDSLVRSAARPNSPPAAAVPDYGFEAESGDGPVTQVDVSLLEVSESNFDSLMQSGVTHSAVRKSSGHTPLAAVANATAELRNLNSSTAFDVRQQAEFFVSLGQTDQAVRILEKHISDSDDPNPHVYLDLLAIFHSLSLKVDFRQFREEFNLLFNGRAQEFASFKNEGQGLEADAQALQAISAVWPTAQALNLIESLIFRDPLEQGSKPFDLAAFRDLLLLHAVAQRIVVAGTAGTALSANLPNDSAGYQSRPYFADSGLGMPVPLGSSLPIPMPSPRPLNTASGELAAAPTEVDLDLGFDGPGTDMDFSLDLDLSSSPPPAPAQSTPPDLGMDLDLSLPLSEPMDLHPSSTPEPVHGNLIDFDISMPDTAPPPDNKTAGPT